MSEQQQQLEPQAQPQLQPPRNRGGLGPVTWAAALLVVVLAVGSLLWPRGNESDPDHVLLVFDSGGGPERLAAVFEPVRTYLADLTESPLELVVAGTVAAFADRLAEEPDFVLAPDALALGAPPERYLPLVVGRRSAPRNLRPRSVLVSRRGAGADAQPWLTRPAATVFGDSVSLVATGVLGRVPRPFTGPAGPDPYDHGPALHALRLGAFDFAVVRQWDAERFVAAGLLDPALFATRELLEPVPDLVVLAARTVPGPVRLRCSEALTGLGRQQAEAGPRDLALELALGRLHLAGFNLLLEPDFELVRKKFPGDWLRKEN